MTSSPECWAMFGELLAVQYNDPARMSFQQLIVDAYAVQHPGDQEHPDPRAVQSVAIHLMTLCLFLEHDVDPALGATLHKAMVARPVFGHLPAPASRGAVTVASMASMQGDADVAAARAAAYDWARSAWAAWAEHHGVVRRWIAEAGLAPSL